MTRARMILAGVALLLLVQTAAAQITRVAPGSSGVSGGGAGATTDYTVSAGVTASTTQAQGQNPATTQVVQVATVANSGDVCVTLPTAAVGDYLWVVNNGANECRIYPASGDVIKDLAANAFTVLGAGGRIYLWAIDATNWDFVVFGGALAATCASSGDANPGALTLTTYQDFIAITNNDTDGCNVTLGEQLAFDARTLRVQNLSTSSITFSTSAGVQQLSPVAVLAQYGSLTFGYRSGQWWAVSRDTPNMYAYTARITTAVTSTSTAYADVTGLSFTVDANKSYEFVAVGFFQTAATTTGIGLAFNGPASPTRYQASCWIATTSGAFEPDWETSYNDMAATTAVQAATANQPFYCHGVIDNGANSGTVILRLKTEVSSSQVSVQPGSMIRHRKFD